MGAAQGEVDGLMRPLAKRISVSSSGGVEYLHSNRVRTDEFRNADC